MKPALSPTTTGTLPSRSASALMSSMTSSSVTTVRMTSTSLSTGAGLKKCIPITCAGRDVATEISVTDSDEVLVARIARGGQDLVEPGQGVLLEVEVLGHRLDDEVALGQVVQRGAQRDPRVDLGGLLVGELAALDRPSDRRVEVAAAPGDGVVADLDADHRDPAAREDLDDAGPHGAQSDDPDGVELARHLSTPCGRSEHAAEFGPCVDSECPRLGSMAIADPHAPETAPETFASLDPATGEEVARFPVHDAHAVGRGGRPRPHRGALVGGSRLRRPQAAAAGLEEPAGPAHRRARRPDPPRDRQAGR